MEKEKIIKELIQYTDMLRDFLGEEHLLAESIKKTLNKAENLTL